MSSVKIIQRKNKPTATGECPLYIQIIHDRKQSEISLKVALKEADWDNNRRRVRNRHPRHAMLNSIFQKRIGLIRVIEHEYQMADKAYTTKDIVKEFKLRRDGLNTDKNLVINLLEDYVNRNPESHPDHTLYNYKAFINCLKVYDYKVTFQSLDHAYFNKYIKYLKDKKKLKQHTIWTRMKFFRKAINLAISERVLAYNPMHNFKVKKGKTKIVYLTNDEIALLEAAELPSLGTKKVRDMFLFMCYTGLRISDLCTLKKSDIEVIDGKTYLYFKIRKTDEILKIKLSVRPIDILNNYRNEDSKYLFNILNEKKNLSNQTDLKNEIKTRTAYYNKVIKSITNKIGIEKNISMHKARSTFATYTLTKGASMEVVSKLLGHSSIKETKVYAEVVGIKRDNAIDLWDL